jgi:flavin-dependent dehydrogenase
MNIEPTVLVLGGGPSGTSIATHIARAGISTAICERSHYESTRVGEALVPAVRPLLVSLGAWDRFLQDGHLRSPGVMSVWDHPEPSETDFLFSPFGSGWHVDRARFDLSLAATAESAGALVLRDAKPISIDRTSNGWKVDLQNTNRVVSFRAQFLVDATGRASWLAQRMGSRRTDVDRMLGLMAWIPTDDSINQDRRLLLEAGESGWWYSAALPNGVLVATYMTDAALPKISHDPLAFWTSQLAQTTYTRKRLARERPSRSVKMVSANSYRMTKVTGDGWIAVGDAAMTWDPLSSQGILKAIHESRSAAAAVRAALSGDNTLLNKHAQDIIKSFDTYCKARHYFYDRVRRWPLSKFWLSRQSASASRSRIQADLHVRTA